MAGSNRGLAAADDETRQRVSSDGGMASGGNFKNDPKRASAEGKKGAEAQPRKAKVEGGRNSHKNR
jgi:general stress protein YciG